MSTLLTFPGQGAQRAGMLHALPDHPVVAKTLDAASEVLGRDIRMLDTAQALASTVSVQLCLLAAGVATARVLIDGGAGVDAVAGLSIGAFPAAVIAGVLRYEEAVRLVALRGKLMEDAYPHGYGMTAILGLDQSALERIVAMVHGEQTPVYLANLNAPAQFVIAGEAGAMARVGELAMAAGAQAARPVAIAVPSHCALLAPQAAALARAFADVAPARPKLRYFSASAARQLRDPARIVEDLAANMAMPVRWHDTMQLARETGMRLAVEMPPGNVLTRLAASEFEVAVACADTRIDSVLILAARYGG
ncbi:malonate decarboxylase subunit epsilon [Cupriavidus plantarum]|uniref:Malonyl CoA-acyl carrier protein transacylase n=1 Tax=Cupriavidus plantarum TaxID=942865 RepID=A0A316ELU6_9BURK|nr:malonate decarboxylase subunit epsilon [Cupriavidus plantarum]PWK31592.1 malonate decarboxylase epsilon subunit [Cupriavidus plantarum]RLK28759.1 malonate decarboxylase epsilon subunit [Cupriavidus plantarum]CAG2145841.1 Malonyl CoA-acyl carrier protein transacylase [Cupriavidus plantarum]SMR86683.1 malonate decarboxylase epsilon subunit [Cupriavidus plantarum]